MPVMSPVTRIYPSQPGEAPMPTVGMLRVISSASSPETPSTTIANATANQERNGFGYTAGGLKLGGVAPRLAHDADRRCMSLLRAALIAPKGQIDDHQGTARSAHHRAACNTIMSRVTPAVVGRP
jgi:hypothetical protein